MSKILLGSESPGRKHVLEKFGFSFDALAPKVNEKSVSGNISLQEAIELVKFNSRLKMDKLKKKAIELNNYLLLITSDTTVFFNNKIYEKTYNKNLATILLGELTGQTHQVITGVTLGTFDENGKDDFKSIELFEITDVTITSNKDLIDFYLLSDDCLGKAGCYGIQGSGSLIIEAVRGSIDNVIGLPMNKIIQQIDSDIMSILKNAR